MLLWKHSVLGAIKQICPTARGRNHLRIAVLAVFHTTGDRNSFHHPREQLCYLTSMWYSARSRQFSHWTRNCYVPGPAKAAGLSCSRQGTDPRQIPALGSIHFAVRTAIPEATEADHRSKADIECGTCHGRALWFRLPSGVHFVLRLKVQQDASW